MTYSFFRNVGVFTFLAFVFAGCAADAPSTVAIQIERPAGFVAASSEVRAFAPPTSVSINFPANSTQTISVSETGLLKSHTCYFINVNGPGLTVAGTAPKSAPASCPFNPPGLGKLYGPYPYGVEAKIQVPSGSSRQFDLVGFLNPYGAADAKCEKPFRSRVMDNGKVVLFYGDFAISADESDAAQLPAGITLAPEPFNSLRVFASNRGQTVTLRPGSSIRISLPAIAWKEENGEQSPTEYACHGSKGSKGSSAEGSPTFPFLQEDANGKKFIRTGMTEKAFLEVKCPAGATHVSLKLTGKNGQVVKYLDTSGSEYSAANCIGDRATFLNIPLATNQLPWKEHGCAANESQCVDFEVFSGTSTEGVAYLDGQFIKSERYHFSANANGTGQFSFGSNSEYTDLKIIGYRKDGDNRYFTVYQQPNEGSQQWIDFHFTQPSSDYPATAPRTLVPAASQHYTSPADISFLESIFVKGLGIFGIYQTNSSGYTEYRLTGISNNSNYALLTSGLSSNYATMATDNGQIISAIGGGGTLYYNNLLDTTNQVTVEISLPIYVSNNFKIRADLPTGEGSIQHIVYFNPSNTTFRYTRCSGIQNPGNNCTNFTRGVSTDPEDSDLFPVDMDFFPDGSNNKRLLVLFRNSNGNYSLRQYHLKQNNGSASIDEVDLNGDGIINDVATFYPDLPANIASAHLKTLVNNDAEITSQTDALLSIKTTPSAPNTPKSFLYRTRDGGKTWFRVWGRENADVLSIHPVHLYQGGNSYKPGFSMLIKEDNQYKLLNEDSFHGF